MGKGADGSMQTLDKLTASGDIVDAKKNKPLYLKIHGKVYDATEFKKRHPGGNVISYYSGADATDVFDNFHFRSKKAQALLKSMPIVEEKEGMIAPYKVYDGVDNNEEMLEDFRKWRQSLIDRGLFEPSIWHLAYRIADLAFWFTLSMLFFANQQIALGVLALGFVSGRFGWSQHEFSHFSFLKNRKIGRFLGSAFIGFGLSASGDLWRHMHNRHHSSCNKEGHDMDLDTTPLVAFYNTAVEKNRRTAFSPTWLKYQAYTFIPITSGMFVTLFWMLYLHPKNALKKGLWDELFWMASSHIGKTALISSMTGFGILPSYALYWASNWVGGCYLFSQFSLSHTFLPTVEADEFPTWVDYALHHTVDQDTQSWFVNYVQGFLNCQVQHHLFTPMPQFRQPEVSKELERFAKKWGRPYHHITYWEAWKRMFANLDDVGKHYFEESLQIPKLD